MATLQQQGQAPASGCFQLPFCCVCAWWLLQLADAVLGSLALQLQTFYHTAPPLLQVMAREIFNPNFSLFVHMPEHGTTFQPNPNSVVQNDEARGTNHLDFFKFVGRVIGKALYDGQLIDAYFTRSFYKHMLGMDLTYEVGLEWAA